MLYPLITSINGIDLKDNQTFYGFDGKTGVIVEINRETGVCKVVNPTNWRFLRRGSDVAFINNVFYIVASNKVYMFDVKANELLRKSISVSRAYGVAVDEQFIYVSTRTNINVYDIVSHKLVNMYEKQSIGDCSLSLNGNDLFLCDKDQSLVTVVDKSKGTKKFMFPTKDINPLGIVATDKVVYTSHNVKTVYLDVLKDKKGNDKHISDSKAVIHKTSYKHENNSVLADGYVLEITYLVEIDTIADDIKPLEEVEWEIALPISNRRQQLLSLEPIGDFPSKIKAFQNSTHQKIAFNIPSITSEHRSTIGYRAKLNLLSQSFYLTDDMFDENYGKDVDKAYLEDDGSLNMDNKYLIEIASNFKRIKGIVSRAKAIRNFVFSKLNYDMYDGGNQLKNYEALQQGKGLCQQYTECLLALYRLCGIPCRSMGQYKYYLYMNSTHTLNYQTENEANHIWVEILLPKGEWATIEVNPDDVLINNKYKEEGFMVTFWNKIHFPSPDKYSFEKIYHKNGIAICSDYSINHVFLKLVESNTI
jgi:transglutaminase-like putative cysteine protease